MTTLSVLTWIGNAASVLFGRHGDVTDQARQAGCSRQAAYEHASRVQQAVAEAQLPGPSREQLLLENQQLRQQVQQLEQRQQRDQRISLDEERRRRLAATAWAMGLSLQQIEELLQLLLADQPQDVCGPPAPSRATLGRWLLALAGQAPAVLAVLDQHARPLAVVLCADEIFFHGRPVLVGVEPHSLALLLCHRAADRMGATWHQALKPFEQLQYAVTDQGTGLQAGLRKLAQDRSAAEGQGQPSPSASTPAAKPLEVGLDIFHIEKEARPVLAREWRRLQQYWDAAEKADEELARANDRRGKKAKAEAAWRCAERQCFASVGTGTSVWRTPGGRRRRR